MRGIENDGQTTFAVSPFLTFHCATMDPGINGVGVRSNGMELGDGSWQRELRLVLGTIKRPETCSTWTVVRGGRGIRTRIELAELSSLVFTVDVCEHVI